MIKRVNGLAACVRIIAWQRKLRRTELPYQEIGRKCDKEMRHPFGTDVTKQLFHNLEFNNNFCGHFVALVINVYTRIWYFPQCLLGAVLLLFSTSVCAQMTPGDEDGFCVSRLGGANSIQGVKVLLDSRHYEQLLGVGGAVWDQIDFDDNNPEGFVNPTYVSYTLYTSHTFSFKILYLLTVATQYRWSVSMVCYVVRFLCWISGKLALHSVH